MLSEFIDKGHLGEKQLGDSSWCMVARWPHTKGLPIIDRLVDLCREFRLAKCMTCNTKHFIRNMFFYETEKDYVPFVCVKCFCNRPNCL